MSRLTVVVALLCGGLLPEALSCAESKPADATVRTRAAAQAGLVEVRALEIPYGGDDASPGFSPAGDEREALGPVAIEVMEDGAIRLTDSMRRRFFDVRFDAAGRAVVTEAGRVKGLEEPGIGGVPTAARAVKTSGEDGAIVFVENGAERRVEIRTGGPLASIRLLGVDRRGRAFALVEKYRELGGTGIDREVIVVDRAGALIAKAALPPVGPVRPLAELYLTPDGALYRLAADAERCRVLVYEVKP